MEDSQDLQEELFNYNLNSIILEKTDRSDLTFSLSQLEHGFNAEQAIIELNARFYFASKPHEKDTPIRQLAPQSSIGRKFVFLALQRPMDEDNPDQRYALSFLPTETDGSVSESVKASTISP